MTLAGRILKPLLRGYERLIQFALAPLLWAEWRIPRFGSVNERSIEYSFALRCLSDAAPETVLDVGPGRSSWPHLMANCGFRVTAIDRVEGYWRGPLLNRHFRVVRGDVTRPQLHDRFDFVTCISVLEHIRDHEAAVCGMIDLLKEGGRLVLTFPFNEHRYVPDVYALPESSASPGSSFICQVFSRAEIDRWLARSPVTIVEQEYFEVFRGAMWSFGDRIYPVRRSDRDGRHHLSCLLLERR